jgi:hypothetical protein
MPLAETGEFADGLFWLAARQRGLFVMQNPIV